MSDFARRYLLTATCTSSSAMTRTSGCSKVRGIHYCPRKAALYGRFDQVREAALISTGEGWLDADPEIEQLKPDIYAVNEDGETKAASGSIARDWRWDYLVLKRTPAPGLPKRSSTT